MCVCVWGGGGVCFRVILSKKVPIAGELKKKKKKKKLGINPIDHAFPRTLQDVNKSLLRRTNTIDKKK